MTTKITSAVYALAVGTTFYALFELALRTAAMAATNM